MPTSNVYGNTTNFTRSIAYPIPETQCGHYASIVEGFGIVENPDAQLDVYLDVDPINTAKYIKAFEFATTTMGTPAERGALANAECLKHYKNPKLDI